VTNPTLGFLDEPPGGNGRARQTTQAWNVFYIFFGFYGWLVTLESFNDTPHVLSRGGYQLLEKKNEKVSCTVFRT